MVLTGIILSGCKKENPADKVETILMYVSSETGNYQPWGSETSFSEFFKLLYLKVVNI